MIHFSFELPAPGSPWRRTWDKAHRVSPATISEVDLYYKYFGVRAEFVVDGVEVISGRGHVTLVDLASSLRHALDRFSSGEDAAIDFTESAEVIQLRHDVNRVLITSSQHEWQVSVDREELVSAFAEFVREAHFRLIEFLPELAENPVIRRLSSG